jgi:hypothetical protein
MTNPENCDAETLAVIAVQFIALGDDEDEALRKANALYLKATAYAKKFASLSPDEKEIEAVPDEAMRALAGREREDLAIGDSEANNPALQYFRQKATTKLDQNITHRKFLAIIERFHDRRPEAEKTKHDKDGHIIPWTPPEQIARGVIDDLHLKLRAVRSRARSACRKKSVK